MNKNILKINGEEIDKALKKENRQYLVGELKRPQLLEHINDSKLEIGITSYDSYTTEAPHTHTQAFEYQYLVSGETSYMDIENDKIYHFSKGDFYVIRPGIKYAQKSKPNTKILFIKVPPGDDKINIKTTKKIKKWFEEPIK